MSRKIGALWKKKKGDLVYLVGEVEQIVGSPLKIVVFKNTKKEKDNQPDWNICLQGELKKEKTEQKAEDNNGDI